MRLPLLDAENVVQVRQIVKDMLRGLVGGAGGGSIVTIDHGSLTGLSDDDHTQYLLTNGTRALSGNWDVGNKNIVNVDHLSINSTNVSLADFYVNGYGLLQNGLAIGVGINPIHAINVLKNASSGSPYFNKFVHDASGTCAGAKGIVFILNGHNPNCAPWGAVFQAYAKATCTPEVVGGVFQAIQEGSGVLTNVTGGRFYSQVNAGGSGNVTTVQSGHFYAPTNAGSSVVINAYAGYFGAPTIGSTLNFSVYAEGKGYFGSNVGIGINVPTALLDINSDILRLRTSKTPASAAAAGNAGDICWDSGYIYVCVAASTWKRVAIATW